jgi:hypothetical protein
MEERRICKLVSPDVHKKWATMPWGGCVGSTVSRRRNIVWGTTCGWFQIILVVPHHSNQSVV